MSADIQIINSALMLLNQPIITDRTDASKQSRVSNVLYDDSYHYLLSSHPFTFALKLNTLTKNDNATAIPPFKYVYNYPTGFLLLRSLKDANGYKFEYTVNVDGIHVYEEKEYFCEFISDTPEENLSALFKQAFSYYLAWQMHASFSNNNSERQSLQQHFHEHWKKCVGSDGAMIDIPMIGADRYSKFYYAGSPDDDRYRQYRYYSS